MPSPPRSPTPPPPPPHPPPPRELWANPDPELLPDFLKRLKPIKPSPQPFPPENLAIASFGGHGTLEALQVSKILEGGGVPCWFCGVSALIYYGAGRVRHCWEICVPTERMQDAESALKPEVDAGTYIILPPHPYPQPGELSHMYPQYRLAGVSFRFVLVPSRDVHLSRCDENPSSLQRSYNGLAYPRLDVLIQSFLDACDRNSLADVVDGSDVSEQWGIDNLDLEGTNDLEWATWFNKTRKHSLGEGWFFGGVPCKPLAKREVWTLAVSTKTGRLGWTRPKELFLTRFRLRGEPDPWLRPRECC